MIGITLLQLSQTHYAQVIKSVAEVEADVATKEYREENYMQPEEPIAVADADVEQYYRCDHGSPPVACTLFQHPL